MPYDYAPFPYKAPPGLTAPEPRHQVVIVGAGPIGLAMALELANHGVPSVVVDDNNVVSVGSRAICWSKRSLEIFDRLGIAERALEKGVTWKVGRTFHGDNEVFNFDLLPGAGYKMPAFINLQQYYVEQFLVEAAQDNPLIDLRFKNKVVELTQTNDFASVRIETPDGDYHLQADYLLACDGAGSPIRAMLGLELDGELFEERFLIADIEMKADFPPERHFWFEPTFHSGQSALLHKQPDNIYRIDLQLGWDADPEVDRKPGNVIPRIAKVVGHDDFELDWVSVYTFQCARLERFVHGRVIFVGDSAHVVSPFGARGGNGGLQDVDNLGWKLAAVLNGATQELLASYELERIFATDENITNSARATKFMTPANGVERLFRDQVLHLASRSDFARAWVNSGRLSRPCRYPFASIDDQNLPNISAPGNVAPDAPLGNGWLIDALRGGGLYSFSHHLAGATEVPVNDQIRTRYLGEVEQAVYLIRPDQVVAARWENPTKGEIEAAKTAMMEGRQCH